jgi:two-component system sensor histidine kinase/response regulator
MSLSSLEISLLFLLLICMILLSYFVIIRKRDIAHLKKNILDGPLSDSKLLYTLIDNMPDRIYLKDRKSRFIAGNIQVAKIMGAKSTEDLIGKTDYDFYAKDLAKEFFRDEQELMKSGLSIINKEERGLDLDGNEIIVSTTKVPFKDEAGSVIGVVGIGRDITPQKFTEKKLIEQQENLREANAQLEERHEEILQQQEELKTTTERFYEEQKQLRTLIDNMPDMIYIKDRQSRFIAGNIHVAKIMGVKSPDILIGKTDFDFYAKDMAQEFYRDEQELLNSGDAIINKEERGLDLNGHEIIVSTTKVPFKDKAGIVIGVVGIGRDITPQKLAEKKLIEQQENLQEANTLLEERQEEINQQAEELHAQAEYLTRINQELEKLSIVASHTDNVIIIMDPDANIEYRNRGYEMQYGKITEEPEKNKLVNLREISSNKDINEIIDEILTTKKAVSYEGKAFNKEGKQFWSQTTISPVLNEKNEIVKLIAIDTDISLIKEAEKEISHQKDQIERNRDELKKLNATKDKFFSIIAHDLKNPFHSIMGFSDLLTRSFDTIEDERKKEFMQLIKDSSTSAYNLLENLLDWSRTQTNNIKFSPANIDISQILNVNIQIHSVIAQNKNIEIIHEIPDQIISYADGNMVNTIVRNLLSNALKFTPQGGKIIINAISGKDYVKVNIQDTGLGMDIATKEKLFRIDEFHNTIGTSGETGTGLGLIICHEFILRHGGEINVESEAGKGSTFSFSLPSEINHSAASKTL